MTNQSLQDAYLTSRLDTLKGELRSVTAPEAIEAELVSNFRRTQARAPRPRLWWMPPLALAATVVVVSWMVRGPAPIPEVGVWRTDGAVPGVEAYTESESDPGPFLALRPLDRIALEPGATVVATEFPRALLADWGLPVSPERAGEPVRAEMLFSAQGEPLAVRVIE